MTARGPAEQRGQDALAHAAQVIATRRPLLELSDALNVQISAALLYAFPMSNAETEPT